MRSFDVIGFGALNTDRIGEVDQVVVDAEVMVRKERVDAGGSAANTICALSNLGMKTAVIGLVGDDREGRVQMESLRRYGVCDDFVKVQNGAQTGLVLGLSDDSNHRALYIYPGLNDAVSWTDLPNIDTVMVDCVHLSSFVSKKQLELQKRFVSNLSKSVLVSLAPGMVYARFGIEAIEPLVSRCNILFLNKEELTELIPGDWKRAVIQLCKTGVGCIVVTDGSRGSCCFDGRDFLYASSESASVVDTTGAGDALAAGF